MKRHPRRLVAHMIRSKRMADHKPHDMICELVDNALGADSHRVWIELGRRSVAVAGGRLRDRAGQPLFRQPAASNGFKG